MARTNQRIRHLRSNALQTVGTSVVKNPTTIGLWYGELGINANSLDPTIYMAKVANATINESVPSAVITDLAEFKSLSWFQTNVIGSTDPSSVRTLKYITDALDLIAADSDSVIDSWNEVKAFLATISDDVTLVSLLNNKADKTISVTAGAGLTGGGDLSAARTLNIVSADAGIIVNADNLKLNLATIIPTSGGSWADVAGTWTYTDPIYSDVANVALRANIASETRDLYNLVNKMFTIVGGKIRANMDFYSIGGISAMGPGLSGGGSGGLITAVYSYASILAAVDATYSDATLTDTANAYSVYMLKKRIIALEGGSFTGMTFTKNTIGFSIGGGNTTVKTLTVSNNITLAANDGATLNIGAGGTLGTGAYATIANYAAIGQIMYIGTTAVAINRTTGAQTLGVDISGLAAKATILATARSIYGNNFDGSAALAQVIAGTYGGTGVNNGAKTITLGGNLSTAAVMAIVGAFALTMNVTAVTNVTLPVSGTLLSTDSDLDGGTF